MRKLSEQGIYQHCPLRKWSVGELIETQLNNKVTVLALFSCLPVVVCFAAETMSTATSPILLKWDPKSLEIRTLTVERLLEPLVTQVGLSPLIIRFMRILFLCWASAAKIAVQSAEIVTVWNRSFKNIMVFSCKSSEPRMRWFPQKRSSGTIMAYWSIYLAKQAVLSVEILISISLLECEKFDKLSHWLWHLLLCVMFKKGLICPRWRSLICRFFFFKLRISRFGIPNRQK